MLMAATLSQHAGLMDAASVQRIKALLLRVGLPLDARAEVTREAAVAAMRIDKKVKAGKLRFILMRGIGRSFVTSDYPEDALEATLAGFFS